MVTCYKKETRNKQRRGTTTAKRTPGFASSGVTSKRK
nr:MAG TPA: hypothetical protein [Bacteriophage sp.]